MEPQAVVQRFEDERRGQRMMAWERSVIVRKQRVELRKALKAREVSYVRVIKGEAHPAIEAVAARCALGSFLTMVPNVGKPRAHDILEAFGRSPSKRLGELEADERRDLAMIVVGATGDHGA